MNRKVRAIVRGLLIIAIIALLSRVARVDLGINREDYAILIYLPMFLGLSIAMWFAPPQRHPMVGRIAVWMLTLWSLWAWGFTPIIHRTSRKAILIFLPLALLVVSEWRYAHPNAAQQILNTKRNILIWLATTVSLVLLWMLIRLIL